MPTADLTITFGTDFSEALFETPGMPINITGRRLLSDEIIVGTTEKAIAYGSGINAGLAYIRNLSETNYVEVGYDPGVYKNRLQPLYPMVVTLHPSNTSIFFRSNISESKVFYRIYQR